MRYVPGFRSGRWWKSAIAVPGWLLISLLIVGGAWPPVSPVVLGVGLAALVIVLLATDAGRVRSHTPVLNSRNRLVAAGGWIAALFGLFIALASVAPPATSTVREQRSSQPTEVALAGQAAPTQPALAGGQAPMLTAPAQSPTRLPSVPVATASEPTAKPTSVPTATPEPTSTAVPPTATPTTVPTATPEPSPTVAVPTPTPTLTPAEREREAFRIYGKKLWDIRVRPDRTHTALLGVVQQSGASFNSTDVYTLAQEAKRVQRALFNESRNVTVTKGGEQVQLVLGFMLNEREDVAERLMKALDSGKPSDLAALRGSLREAEADAARFGTGLAGLASELGLDLAEFESS